TFDKLVLEYQSVLRLDSCPVESKLGSAILQFLKALSDRTPVSESERRTRLLALVNKKFDINKEPRDALYGACARAGITFNYREKLRLCEAFDRSEIAIFSRVMLNKGV